MNTPESTDKNTPPNHPSHWAALIPVPGVGGNKYDRGHVVVLGGRWLSGAARMGAEAAMRIGAGLCTIVADPAAATAYRCGAPHIMFEPLTSLPRFAGHLADARRNAVLIGPGAGGLAAALRRAVLGAVLGVLDTRRAAVLDADALSVFSGRERTLFDALHDRVVLTPHEGEFERLFGHMKGDRVERALNAASRSGAVIVLKGAETIIAHPDGRVSVNTHATPWLASAGTGDVLAGMMIGLLAQGMEPFDAARAAVWIHGEAGIRTGPGLIAPDLIEKIPAVLKDVFAYAP